MREIYLRLTNHTGQLSLAIPPWVGTMITGKRAVMLCNWGVKAAMVLFAGNTVWSISDRVKGVCVDVLYKSTYTLLNYWTNYPVIAILADHIYCPDYNYDKNFSKRLWSCTDGRWQFDVEKHMHPSKKMQKPMQNRETWGTFSENSVILASAVLSQCTCVTDEQRHMRLA